VRGSEEWFGARGAVGAMLVLTGVIASEIQWAPRQEGAAAQRRHQKEAEGALEAFSE